MVKKLDRSKIFLISSMIILIAIVILSTNIVLPHSMEERRNSFVLQKEGMQHDLMEKGMYRCCLEKPCTYCIEKTPGHGEGAACNCLEDVVNGVHPCGECIGEILEGHGNPYLEEYFAEAIAEEVGMQHLDTIEQIIEEKYRKDV